MATGFLQMCGPVETADLAGGIVAGTAELDLFRFRLRGEVRSAFLLIEGINQFAVRLGRRVLKAPDDLSHGVLPVSLRSFRQELPIEESTLTAVGEASVFGASAFVSVSVHAGGRGGARIAVAQVVVAAAAAPSARVRPEAKSPAGAGRLNVFSLTDSKPASVAFGVNGGGEVMQEHFPGNPIVPASLMLEFVCRAFGPGPDEMPALRNVRFLKPVVPGGSYRCRIEGDGVESRFIVLDGDHVPVVRGEII